jgi:DNA-binding NarL/FixJ family response regulator
MSQPDATRPIRVVVADDQTAIREALATLLGLFPDIDVVATAPDGAEAVTAVGRENPDVVLMDLRMPGVDGVEATRQIGARHPDVAVVVLTTFADEEAVLAALGAGARGYLTKDAGRDDIARAIRAAAAGQAILDRAVQARLIAAATASPSSPPAGPPAAAGAVPAPAELTPREREVLTLIGEGLSNRAIARQLFVSESTVKTHINNLFAKAGLRDRAEAVRYAFTHGLVRPA